GDDPTVLTRSSGVRAHPKSPCLGVQAVARYRNGDTNSSASVPHCCTASGVFDVKCLQNSHLSDVLGRNNALACRSENPKIRQLFDELRGCVVNTLTWF